MNDKNVIEIKGLKKYFPTKFGFGPKVKAVDGISFEVKKGEVFGFLGPNGAGKTTTIRCLMDFLKPSEGTISVAGFDSQENSVSLRSHVGYLPGNVKLNDKWTGEEHVKLAEAIRGKSNIVDMLVEKLNLDITRKFHDLSSGNKQKLGLILALMNEPEVLVMDEPTVGLDPLLQNVIYEILKDMKEKGVTIFVSSHNLSEVEKICDRVGIIKEGKMVEVQTMKELQGKKLHRVEVRFNDSFSQKEFTDSSVETIEKIPQGLILTVTGDIDRVIKKISAHKVSDIEITHATLEEIFLKYYERK